MKNEKSVQGPAPARVIKFRAWDKGNEQMIYALPASNCTNGDLLNRWDDEHLMQFTGLLDKKGQEIYEGDIIKCDVLGGQEGYDIDCICKVDYDDDMAGFIITSKIKGLDSLILPHLALSKAEKWYLLLYESENREVIGNIYENPELLFQKHED